MNSRGSVHRMGPLARDIDCWVLDLDGVVWLADQVIPGASEAVELLRSGGKRVIFATNNSSATLGEQVAKLASFGIQAVGDVVTSAQAAACLLEPGMSAIACAGPGVVEALEVQGVKVLDSGPVDAVVVGFHTNFDYARLSAAHRAVDAGARLIGTNDDPTYPTPDGPTPGGGAILAAVATAVGVVPEVAGKPYAPMANLVRSMLGNDVSIAMVGDRPSTDGSFAKVLNAAFVLVLSGVTNQNDDELYPVPDLICDDLLSLAKKVAWR